MTGHERRWKHLTAMWMLPDAEIYVNHYACSDVKSAVCVFASPPLSDFTGCSDGAKRCIINKHR